MLVERSQSLWSEWFSSKTVASRNALVDFYLPWLKKLSSIFFSRYRISHYEWDDYVHFGLLGLIQSIEKYDAASQAQFKSYAFPRIKGAILDGIYGRTSKGERANEQVKSIVASHGDFDNKDLEAWVGLIVDLAMTKLLEISGFTSIQHLNDPLDIYAKYRQSHLLLSLVGRLPEKNQFVIACYYRRYLTFKQISELLGVSRARVSQIHAESIELLQQLYGHAYR